MHPFGRKLLRVGVRAPILSTSAAGKRSKKPPGILSRLVAAADVMDIALYLWLVHARATLSTFFGGREVWLVGDRSMDDVLIKHWNRGTLSRGAVTLIRRIVPRFGVTVWLEVEPQVAMDRDGDFALSYYEELHTAYSTVAKWFGWRMVREAGKDPQAVHASIVEALALPGSRPDARESLGGSL